MNLFRRYGFVALRQLTGSFVVPTNSLGHSGQFTDVREELEDWYAPWKGLAEPLQAINRCPLPDGKKRQLFWPMQSVSSEQPMRLKKPYFRLKARFNYMSRQYLGK